MANNEEQTKKMSKEETQLAIKQMEYSMTPMAQAAEQMRILGSQARMYSNSTIVPKQFMGNEGNCAIAVDMAQRMGCNPLMVMQNLAIVNGNPSFSSKFLIAALNATGQFSPLDYEFVGEEGKDSWGCYATAIRLKDGKVLKGTTVTMKMAKAEGWSTKSQSKWQTMPEQMLRYRAAAFFQRIYAPEVSMGFISTEEAVEITPTEDTTYEDLTPHVETAAERAKRVLMESRNTAFDKAAQKGGNELTDEEKRQAELALIAEEEGRK